MPAINLTWWNLGNFFDTDDDPISQDFEYTAANGWTPEVFAAKKANLAAALRATHGGAGPDLLAVAEIEKDSLLEALATETGNPNLKVVHDPSGTNDLRGIDVALAYDERKLRPVSAASHVVHLRYRTRDIFEVEFDVIGSGERLVVLACHWPSRKQGMYESEPLRCAVAENVAYLVEARVKFPPAQYLALQAANDLAAVQRRWNAKVLVVGDFNDEPWDRSLVQHLMASREMERVTGTGNDITKFAREVADYRADDVFLFNPMWKFAAQQQAGTHFMDAIPGGGPNTNRYSLLDQIVVSRGLLASTGLRLDVDSVAIFRDALVATPSGRARPFDWKRRKGTSDHLPLTAQLVF